MYALLNISITFFYIFSYTRIKYTPHNLDTSYIQAVSRRWSIKWIWRTEKPMLLKFYTLLETGIIFSLKIFSWWYHCQLYRKSTATSLFWMEHLNFYCIFRFSLKFYIFWNMCYHLKKIISLKNIYISWTVPCRPRKFRELLFSCMFFSMLDISFLNRHYFSCDEAN